MRTGQAIASLRALFSPSAIFCCSLLPARSQPAQQIDLGAPGRTNGSFGFSLTAPPGRAYVIETSTNLAAWSPVLTNIVPAGSASFTETNVSQLQSRFYRGHFYWTVIVPNTYSAWQTTNTGSGRLLAFPAGWKTAKGADGRTIAFPSGWISVQGRDGRMIAHPVSLAFDAKQGVDGRLVTFLQFGPPPVPGADGRVVALPSADLTSLMGLDGRRIAVPSTNFSTTKGRDGRLAAFPSAGWTNSQGSDGRSVSYVASEFTTVQGADGRKVAYPHSGWTSRQGPDGRMVSYPTSTNATIELDFLDQSLFSLLANLKPVLSQTNFNDYAVYLYFGTGEQQFTD